MFYSKGCILKWGIRVSVLCFKHLKGLFQAEFLWFQVCHKKQRFRKRGSFSLADTLIPWSRVSIISGCSLFINECLKQFGVLGSTSMFFSRIWMSDENILTLMVIIIYWMWSEAWKHWLGWIFLLIVSEAEWKSAFFSNPSTHSFVTAVVLILSAVTTSASHYSRVIAEHASTHAGWRVTRYPDGDRVSPAVKGKEGKQGETDGKWRMKRI